jgi:N-acetylglucosaminyldiphosphoundecaprenol N-acetyl-beta-D-mannosaminyltransferase
MDSGRRIDLMGCPIDALTLEETLTRIEDIVRRREPTQQMSVNAAKFVNMCHDAALRRAVRSAPLIHADGASIVFASRVLGKPVPERVAGCDLFEALLARAPSKGWRTYFLGARPEVLDRAMARARERFPGIRFAGHHHGYFTPEAESWIADDIRASQADLLFVAMGSPKKETFLDRWLHEMKVPYAMGVGGSFEILAGTLARAPRWMQFCGLEWAWRTALEPRRMWRRGIVDSLRFVGRVAQARTIGFRLPR